MKKLVLLGAWNESPLTAWPWFADNGIEHFYKLTKVKVRNFSYLKNNLYYQYFFAIDTDKLYNRLQSLSNRKQLEFVKKICDDYFFQSKKITRLFKSIKIKNFKNFSTSELIKLVQNLNTVLSLATMQIWFVVLLDIWYPGATEKTKLKEIGIKTRDHSGNLHNHAKKILDKIIESLSQRLKFKKEDIYYFFPEELEIVLNNKKEYIEKIRQRKKLCVTTNILGKYSIFEEKRAQLFSKKYVPSLVKSIKKKNVFRGMPTSPGKIRGRVRVVLLDSQFKDFKKGEILVALQTMVSFMPIMKKAKAILTEFGGMTSHAAIVSREFNIPCIVGIRNITKILKTGDLVEVDADKGIVRILERY